jgi:hypothetical protein
VEERENPKNAAMFPAVSTTLVAMEAYDPIIGIPSNFLVTSATVSAMEEIAPRFFPFPASLRADTAVPKCFLMPPCITGTVRVYPGFIRTYTATFPPVTAEGMAAVAGDKETKLIIH